MNVSQRNKDQEVSGQKVKSADWNTGLCRITD